MEIAHGPFEVIIGIVAGILWGIVLAFIPNRNDVSFIDKILFYI